MEKMQVVQLMLIRDFLSGNATTDESVDVELNHFLRLTWKSPRIRLWRKVNRIVCYRSKWVPIVALSLQ